MDGGSFFLFLLIAGVLFGIGGMAIADARGGSPVGGFLLGAFLGPIGLLIACFIGPVESPPPARSAPTPAPPRPTTKVCPRCAEDVKAAALVCRYCGHEFEPPAVEDERPAVAPAQIAVEQHRGFSMLGDMVPDQAEDSGNEGLVLLALAFAIFLIAGVVILMTGQKSPPGGDLVPIDDFNTSVIVESAAKDESEPTKRPRRNRPKQKAVPSPEVLPRTPEQEAFDALNEVVSIGANMQ
jgi:hypothetical protein